MTDSSLVLLLGSKPGRFYLMPKIHKENNPGRPIVSANGHPTEKISEFIDFHLRPFVENLPSGSLGLLHKIQCKVRI
jgi:hypothetical protein